MPEKPEEMRMTRSTFLKAHRRFPEAIGGVGCIVTLTHGKPAFFSSGVVAKTAGTLSSPSSKKSSPLTLI
jgi:hypothetical protein